jgi:hypothetical protein
VDYRTLNCKENLIHITLKYSGRYGEGLELRYLDKISVQYMSQIETDQAILKNSNRWEAAAFVDRSDPKNVADQRYQNPFTYCTTPPKMEHRSPLGVLPPELYIMILNYLDYPDETGRAPMAIFGLALSSNSMYQFVQYWVSTLGNVDDEYAKISSLQLLDPPPGYPRSYLAVYCKQHAGICALCTLRKYKLEHFSQLQLCHACDLKYFLKISKDRLYSLYYIRSRKEVYIQLLKNELPCVTAPHEDSSGLGRTATWYLWADVQRMKSKGYLRPLKIFKWEQATFKNEEYTYHLGSRQDLNSSVHWNGRLVSIAALAWCKSESISKPIALFGQISCSRRPLVIEAAHFIEFRYRFDPNWQPPGPESLTEFIRMALPWANETYWELRPWRVSNFPHHPRSLIISDLGVSGRDKKQAEHDMKMYQYRCTKIRAVLKAFPEILLSPKTWQKCMLEHRGLSVDRVRSMAREESLTWMGYTPNDMQFGIHRWSCGKVHWDPRLFWPQSVEQINRCKSFGIDVVKIKDGSLVIGPPIQKEDLEWRRYHI